MFDVVYLKRFKKDFKKLQKSGRFDRVRFKKVLEFLQSGKEMPAIYKDHQLKGKLQEFRECHLGPDLLLMYSKDEDVLVLYLFRIGSHGRLFR